MTRIEKEKNTVTAMIEIYCKKNHQHKSSLCLECSELNAYAQKRLTFCKHGETKSFCVNCKTQCYAPKYKAQIKSVMRFSGPWMFLYHPIMAISHLIETRKSKK